MRNPPEHGFEFLQGVYAESDHAVGNDDVKKFRLVIVLMRRGTPRAMQAYLAIPGISPIDVDSMEFEIQQAMIMPIMLVQTNEQQSTSLVSRAVSPVQVAENCAL